jgi:hypothetical protein
LKGLSSIDLEKKYFKRPHVEPGSDYESDSQNLLEIEEDLWDAGERDVFGNFEEEYGSYNYNKPLDRAQRFWQEIQAQDLPYFLKQDQTLYQDLLLKFMTTVNQNPQITSEQILQKITEDFLSINLDASQLLHKIQEIQNKSTEFMYSRVATMGQDPQQFRNLINTVTLMCIKQPALTEMVEKMIIDDYIAKQKEMEIEQ